MSKPSFQFDDPDSALRALAERLSCVGVERGVDRCTARILAQDVTADRDSPAADVSAMDGYAIRMSDLAAASDVPVDGQSAPGNAPPAMRDGAIVRIFTGAIVPDDAEAVVKREDTEEFDDAIRFRPSAMSTTAGDHIRRAGENAPTGSTVLSKGTRITAARRATMANFGCDRPDVYVPVRVSILTTGDEVGTFDKDVPKPWQLRNSNRASLSSLLDHDPAIKVQEVAHCVDDRDSLAGALAHQLKQSDAVLLTGGVSMGDYDYVPEVIQQLGGEIVFHGLPLRPGKPILGAATADGKLIVGLPGNPVSATVGCRRMAMPLIASMGGQADWMPVCTDVRLSNADEKTIPLHWMRLVRLIEHGTAEIVVSQGSGDLVSLGQSTGFVHVPPGQCGPGPWPYYPW